MNRRVQVLRKTDRRGLSVIELLAAVSLIGAMTLFLVPILSKIREADGAATRRAFALREAGNIIEQMRRQPSSAVPELDEEVAAVLHTARVELIEATKAQAEGIPATSQRTLVLSWEEPSGRRSVQLTWWDMTTREEAQ